MAFLNRSEVFDRFKKLGRNSSHFVWFLAEVKFYETRSGWIFSYRTQGQVTLIALEPLYPESSPSQTAFDQAWAEFCEVVEPRISAFVSIYAPFLPLLEKHGFQAVKVGEEPWMDLANCIPKGNAGKGVRSARNQALHSGLTVEEWTGEQIAYDQAKRETIQEIYDDWRSTRLVNLEGFLNATDPFAHSESRRYFVLRSPRRIEAYLVASPVPATGSYFLEDLIARSNAPRGTGELLTLEAMVALQKLGGHQASLGVVSMTQLDTNSARGLPKLIKLLMITIPKYFGTFYNFQGLETYRKRFKPAVWENVYLATKVHSPGITMTGAWLRVLWALLRSFRPRFQLTARYVYNATSRALRRYPLTLAMIVLNFSLFAWINHFSDLPEWALSRFGFTANAPLSEWFTRSVVSDYLYFNPSHFLCFGLAYIAAIYWAEKSHQRRFIIPFVLSVSVFDDFYNYLVLVRPFNYFQPSVFHDLVTVKDVGSSLGLAALLGLQLCQFRRLREPLFALISIGLVLAYLFTSTHIQALVTNLNHALFFVTGFLIGKAKFEYGRHLSRLASKRKPPLAACVLPPHPTAPLESKTGQRRKAA